MYLISNGQAGKTQEIEVMAGVAEDGSEGRVENQSQEGNGLGLELPAAHTVQFIGTPEERGNLKSRPQKL